MDEPSLAARFVINVAEAMGLVCAKRLCTTSSVNASKGIDTFSIPRRRLWVRSLTGLEGYGACLCKRDRFLGSTKALPYQGLGLALVKTDAETMEFPPYW